MAPHTHEFQVINPANRVAAKVHNDGGPPLNTIIDQVDSALEDLAVQFAAATRESIKTMRCAQLLLESHQSPRALKIIARECHEIRGQAATFGRPLLGKAAAALDDFILSNRNLALERHDIVKLHLDALKVLMELKAEGDFT